MSEVWNHFKMGPNGLSVTCNHCNKFMKRSDSSTKSMWGHLKAWHIGLVGEETFRLKRVRRIRGERNRSGNGGEKPSGKKSKSKRGGGGLQFADKTDFMDMDAGGRRSTSLGSAESTVSSCSTIEQKTPAFSLLSIESLLAKNKHRPFGQNEMDFKSKSATQKDVVQNVFSQQHQPFNSINGPQMTSAASAIFPSTLLQQQQAVASLGLAAPADQSQQLAQLMLLANAGLLQQHYDPTTIAAQLKLHGAVPTISPAWNCESALGADYSALFSDPSKLGDLYLMMAAGWNWASSQQQQQQNFGVGQFGGSAAAAAPPSAFVPQDLSSLQQNSITANALSGRSAFSAISGQNPSASLNKKEMQQNQFENVDVFRLKPQQQPAQQSPSRSTESFPSTEVTTAECSPLFVLADTATSTAAAAAAAASLNSSSSSKSFSKKRSSPNAFVNHQTATSDSGLSMFDLIQRVAFDLGLSYTVRTRANNFGIELFAETDSSHPSSLPLPIRISETMNDVQFSQIFENEVVMLERVSKEEPDICQIIRRLIFFYMKNKVE